MATSGLVTTSRLTLPSEPELKGLAIPLYHLDASSGGQVVGVCVITRCNALLPSFWYA